MVSSRLKYYFVFHQITENSSYIRIIKRVYQLMNQLKNLEIGVSYEKCNIYIYILIQCTWGLPQTFLGFIVLLFNIKNKHYFYHGAIITERNIPSSVSLGMFVFTTTNPMKDKRTKNKISDEELSKRLLVHEYGYTIQSLIFGPLYLIVMGIPSTLWGFLPYFQNKRNNGVSYFRQKKNQWKMLLYKLQFCNLRDL